LRHQIKLTPILTLLTPKEDIKLPEYSMLGADILDCGVGIDIIIDFSVGEVDGNAGFCDEIPVR
jgi:hypothetical protein